MKNKKLLKTILWVTSGIGFAASIPFITTSCGSSSVKLNPLPYEVYKYDSNDSTILTGFTDEFLADTSKYSQYDTIEIPKNVTSIVNNAFYNDSEKNSIIPSFIKNLTFASESEIETIGKEVFSKWQSLTRVYFPESLKSIVDSSFENCTQLNLVDLSKCTNLELIDSYAFDGCSSLKSIDLSNCTNLSIISDSAFSRANLTSADLSKCINLSSINMYAFSYNSRLTSVKFPTSLTKIGWCAFAYTSLTSVDLSKCASLTSVDEFVFSNCKKLTSITFPNSLNTIRSNAFQDCSSLTSVVFPSSLGLIASQAFSNCFKLNFIEWVSWKGESLKLM